MIRKILSPVNQAITHVRDWADEKLRIEHIRQLQLQGKDSTNIFNQSDNGRKRSEE